MNINGHIPDIWFKKGLKAARDSSTLRDAIIEVCTKPNEAFRRASKAFAFANSRTWDDAAGEYIKLFEEILT